MTSMMARAHAGMVTKKAILICLIFCCIASRCKAENEAEKSIVKSEYVNRGDKGYNFEWV